MSQTSVLEHNLAGIDQSLDCDFSNILFLLGPMHPNHFDSEGNGL